MILIRVSKPQINGYSGQIALNPTSLSRMRAARWMIEASYIASCWPADGVGMSRRDKSTLVKRDRKKPTNIAKDADSTRGQEAYENIRRHILKGDFVPAALLSEGQLAEQLNLSRTPVREALTRLEQEGMVRTVVGRGTFVTELTIHDIMEIYQVRGQLEPFAARIAAERMDDEGLCELKRIVEQMHSGNEGNGIEDAYQTDINLHKAIVRSTQNKRMVAFLATLDDQMHRVRYMCLRTPSGLESALAEHDLIVKCILDHDPDGAEDAMRKHLHSSCENAVRFLMPMRID